jgi:hypothetical protein
MQVISKSPIPKTESYPLKLSDLQQTLEGVPQSERLDVQFWRYERAEDRSKTVKKILTLSYSRSKVGLTTSTDSIEHLIQPKWRIQVSPVPKDLRHHIHDLLIAEALPHAKEWLIKTFANDGESGAFWAEYKYDFALEKLIVPRKTEVRGT